MFPPVGHLSFSIISCLFAEALDSKCCMLLIDCFQIISYILGVLLSEETTEGLVKYFYAPQMGVCLVTVSKLHHFVQLTKEYIALSMCICGLLFFMVLQNFLNWNENLTNIQFYSDRSGAMGCGVILGTSSSYFCRPLEWKLDIREVITFLEPVT